MKVFLDDVREAPKGWKRVFWPQDAIALLMTGSVDEISLDHDLGNDKRGTGYDVITWMEQAVIERGLIPPKINIHSANPVARRHMEAGIRSIENRYRKRFHR